MIPAFMEKPTKRTRNATVMNGVVAIRSGVIANEPVSTKSIMIPSRTKRDEIWVMKK